LTPDLVVAHDAIGSSNKISYISPRWNGFQFGLTYLPDAMAKGTVTGIMKYPSKTYSNTEIALNDNDPSFKPGFRNVYDLAISYETKINQIDLSSFINGEIGTSKNFEDSSGKLYTRKPLRAWEGGASLTFQNFTVGASYGNWGVSGIYKGTSHNYKRHSSFYTLGAGYSMGDLSTAITYFNSRAAGGVTGITQQDKDDKVKLLSFAVQYKLMPGFMPYAEVTNFNLSQHSQVTNKGYISLIGAKISF
jgi:predicted porin